MLMKTIKLFSDMLVVVWVDGSEAVIKYSDLRSSCPCAFCSGEKDVLGNKYGGSSKINFDVSVVQYEKIGHYGVQFFWSDGHKDGIYTFEKLRALVS